MFGKNSCNVVRIPRVFMRFSLENSEIKATYYGARAKSSAMALATKLLSFSMTGAAPSPPPRPLPHERAALGRAAFSCSGTRHRKKTATSLPMPSPKTCHGLPTNLHMYLQENAARPSAALSCGRRSGGGEGAAPVIETDSNPVATAIAEDFVRSP